MREEHRIRVFESWLLRGIFGPKRDEVRVEWRKVHNEELRDLYPSPSIIRVIKWRRMRWAEHAARMGKRRGVFKVWWGTWRKETTWEKQAEIVFVAITQHMPDQHDRNVNTWDCICGHKLLLITREIVTPEGIYSVLFLKGQWGNILIIKKMISTNTIREFV